MNGYEKISLGSPIPDDHCVASPDGTTISSSNRRKKNVLQLSVLFLGFLLTFLTASYFGYTNIIPAVLKKQKSLKLLSNNDYSEDSLEEKRVVKPKTRRPEPDHHQNNNNPKQQQEHPQEQPIIEHPFSGTKAGYYGTNDEKKKKKSNVRNSHHNNNNNNKNNNDNLVKETTDDFDDDEEDNDYKSLVDKLLYQHHPTITANRPHQFLHLHHMKTAGTSMDEFFACARQRYTQITGIDIPYTNLHECSKGAYQRCLRGDGDDGKCRKTARHSSMMSFCAPLRDLPTFGWNTTSSGTSTSSKTQALTVLRHPVDRVWSMFRFRTKSCYKCQNLTDVYDALDEIYGRGNNQATMAASEQLDLCHAQIVNHQTRNLLSINVTKHTTEEEILHDAISNMKSFFTIIGITEQLNATIDMVSKVFPWMAPDYSNDYHEHDDSSQQGKEDYHRNDRDGHHRATTVKGDHHHYNHQHHNVKENYYKQHQENQLHQQYLLHQQHNNKNKNKNKNNNNNNPSLRCEFPHANPSPANNYCGPNDSHWDLPDRPDDATRKAIMEHNQLDVKLYHAAVQHFELQKRVLGMIA